MKKAIAAVMSAVMLTFGAAAFAACENGGSDVVTLQSYNSESQIVALLQQAQNSGAEAYGVLGEPSLTNGKAEVSSISVAVDFQEEWTAITEFDGYPQASLIARGTFAQSDPAFIAAFSEALKDNASWLSQEENIDKFEQKLAAYNAADPDGYQTTLAGKTYTTETIANCNLGYQSAQEVKASVKDYVNRLSGSEPADGFFYAAPASGAQAQAEGDKTVDVYLPDGTPAFALAKVFTEGVSVAGYTVRFHIVAAGQIGTIFSSTAGTEAEADLAVMPTIGAANVYAKAGGIQLVSTHVFGNLYIASVNGTADSLEDLRGKTVYTTAATTIQLLQYLLTANGIEYTV